jgi:hypothetical protein
MPNFDMHYGVIAGGLILVLILAYAVYRWRPPHWLTVMIGFLMLGTFAVGTGTKLVVTWNNDKGLQMQIAALEKKLAEQNIQVAALQGAGEQITVLEKKIVEQNIQVAALQSAGERITALEKKIAEQTTQIAALINAGGSADGGPFGSGVGPDPGGDAGGRYM